MTTPAKTHAPPGLAADRPTDPVQLYRWIYRRTGVRLARKSVCPDHDSPWDCFKSIHLERPSVSLIVGARGSGKSFLSALDTHLVSRTDPNHGTRILGGSKAQSAQIFEALQSIALGYPGDDRNDAGVIDKLRRESVTYTNGSRVEILAASSRSVRGPHVPSLKLDEVDEMDDDIRESAMGMCMGRTGRKGRRGRARREATGASVVMTSTCHRTDGPMSRLIDRAVKGEFSLHTMCTFEILERCPESRSGRHMERCPACPLKPYCHDVVGGQLPKAKRSNGHYPIESLIQKLKVTSVRVFEADYLCKPTSNELAWFKGFSADKNVSEKAECTNGPEVYVGIDSGVFTGAVLFQVVKVKDDAGELVDEVHVFAEHLSEDLGARNCAEQILQTIRTFAQGNRYHAVTDPAGSSRTPIGLTVESEYGWAGLNTAFWPSCLVSNSLALLDSFVQPATGGTRLLIHPRCVRLIHAFQAYRRGKRKGQILDRPADPQHPHEDLIDALRGGLTARFPNGRYGEIPNSKLKMVSISQVF